MYREVHKYIQHCEICQKINSETLSPAWLLQRLPIPCQVYDDITLDFIEGLITSHNKGTILVVVDKFSKPTNFLTLTQPFVAKGVTKKFMEWIIKLYGLPKSIISDHNLVFIKRFWKEVFQMLGTKLQLSSTYHPQTNDQKEVVNHYMEQYLWCFMHQWLHK